MKRNTNPKTPPGWQRQPYHGQIDFVRTSDGVRVQKHFGNWLIMERIEGQWRSRPGKYSRWIDATTAADGGAQ